MLARGTLNNTVLFTGSKSYAEVMFEGHQEQM